MSLLFIKTPVVDGCPHLSITFVKATRKAYKQHRIKVRNICDKVSLSKCQHIVVAPTVSLRMIVIGLEKALSTNKLNEITIVKFALKLFLNY